MPPIPAIEVEDRLRDFLELRERRRKLIRWILIAVGVAGLTVFGLAGMRVLRHISAAIKLHTKALVVDWYHDDRPFWQGGSCMVTYQGLANNSMTYTEVPRLEPGDFALLNNLARIEILDLSSYPLLRDDLLVEVGGLQGLKELRLGPDETRPTRTVGRLTDAVTVPISRLTHLKTLSLAGHRITDKGAANLVELTELEELDLDRTRITDRALPLFAKLPNLRYLRLAGSQITDKGVAEMQRVAPHIVVLWMNDEPAP